MTPLLSWLKRLRAVGIALVLTFGGLLLPAVGVKASNPRITHGDAQAILEAFPTGGRTLLFRAGLVGDPLGSPADFRGSNGAIRPFAGSPWDGAHFCRLDWHVIVFATFDGSVAGSPRTPEDVKAYLSSVDVYFTLDGSPLETTTTAVRRFLEPQAFGLVDAYGFQAGRIMSPSDLSVGAHDLDLLVVDPVYGDFSDGITFYIDAPGGGACV